MTSNADRRSGRVYWQALDLIIGLPAHAAPMWSAFPPAVPPADVEVDAGDAASLSSAVTHAVVERTAMLTVHAAVVHCTAGALVFPGPSGMGKSTLTVALVRAGFGLMSDEMAAFDRMTGLVSSFPRPITVDVGSPAASHLAGIGLPTGPEIAIDLAKIGSVGPKRARVAGVIVPERCASGGTELSAESGSEAIGALITHAFNHYRSARSSLAVLAQVVEGAEVLRLTYSEAENAATVIASRFEPVRSG